VKNNKTVFVSGHFNVLHPGHLRLLRFAKECGDRLIIGLISDRTSRTKHKVRHVYSQLFYCMRAGR